MEDQEFTGHTGVLSEDSPKVYRLLKRKYPALLSDLEATYLLTFTHHGLREIGILREDGVRFHPQPLRILELVLLEDHTAEDLPVFKASLLLSVADLSALKELSSEVKDLVLQVHQLEKAPDSEVQNGVIRILLARLLDVGRHLHMGTRTAEEQYQQLVSIEELNNVLGPRAPGLLTDRISSWVRIFKGRRDIAPLCSLDGTRD